MIVLFTDFGLEGPYTGQVKAVLWREAPRVPVFDLFANLPPGRHIGAAYLLAAYADSAFPAASVFMCVVDPGVGTFRPAEALHIDGRWFVGPGNGLFEPLLRRARSVEAYVIVPGATVSATFHGRDVFAPAAGKLARGATTRDCGLVPAQPTRRPDWPDDLAEIVYLDRLGNAMTGLRAAGLTPRVTLEVGGRSFAHAHTFADVAAGTAFWFENANGLAEIAVNLGRADALPGMAVGAPVVTVAL